MHNTKNAKSRGESAATHEVYNGLYCVVVTVHRTTLDGTPVAAWWRLTRQGWPRTAHVSGDWSRADNEADGLASWSYVATGDCPAFTLTDLFLEWIQASIEAAPRL